MRSKAKMVNYGIVYGLSAYGLADRLRIEQEEAQEFIDRYLERFPAVARFMADAVTQAEEHGYVSTLFGRRRQIPEIRARNWQTRKLGERLAVNTIIQGTAADIIKVAMVRCHDKLAEAGLATRTILQIHDELLFEGPEDEARAGGRAGLGGDGRGGRARPAAGGRRRASARTGWPRSDDGRGRRRPAAAARRDGLLLLGALLLAAVALRPQLVGAGPLIPDIQDDLGVSHAVAGLVATIPVLCMGLFAPLGRAGCRRAGACARRWRAACWRSPSSGSAARVAPGIVVLLALTLPIGDRDGGRGDAAAGRGQAALRAPAGVRERDRRDRDQHRRGGLVGDRGADRVGVGGLARRARGVLARHAGDLRRLARAQPRRLDRALRRAPAAAAGRGARSCG